MIVAMICYVYMCVVVLEKGCHTFKLLAICIWLIMWFLNSLLSTFFRWFLIKIWRSLRWQRCRVDTTDYMHPSLIRSVQTDYLSPTWLFKTDIISITLSQYAASQKQLFNLMAGYHFSIKRSNLSTNHGWYYPKTATILCYNLSPIRHIMV